MDLDFKNRLWVEKYRPKQVTEYVFTDERHRTAVSSWIEQGACPNLIFAGDPGTGKTTLAKVLINELNIGEYDVLEINASRDNGVDFIREKIEGFVQTVPFGTFKVALLDECLDEDTSVTVLRDGGVASVPIKDVNDSTDLVKSFNISSNTVEWMPFEKMDKGVQETYTIELANGDVVTCTASHKWYVYDRLNTVKVVRTDELDEFMHILSPK